MQRKHKATGKETESKGNSKTQGKMRAKAQRRRQRQHAKELLLKGESKATPTGKARPRAKKETQQDSN